MYRLRSWMAPKSHYDLLAEEVSNVTTRAEDIRSRIDSYRGGHSVKPTREVENWLSNADDLVSSWISIIDTWKKASSFWKISELRQQANQLIEQAQKLSKEADLFSELVTEVYSIAKLREVTYVVGMENYLQELYQHAVADETVARIGICGVQGSGKTALLISFYNKAIDLNIFDRQMFVTVSREFDIRSVQKQILECLRLPRQQNTSVQIQATTIYTALLGKKYLLALDDVWEGLDFEAIGLPDPRENESKVVFTTRSESVIMEAQRNITIHALGMKESWELFCRIAGDRVLGILFNPKVIKIGKRIVKKCDGLPLAIVTVGRAAAPMRTELEWQRALDRLNRSVKTTNVSKSLDVIMLATIGFSYEMLGSQLLKDCFLYCSLFPKNYSITKDELIGYWIGEGFIEGHEAQMFQNIGCHLIDQLIEASLLQEGNNHHKSEVSMNDGPRQFALNEIGNRFLVEAGRQLTTLPSSTKWGEVERVSLMNCHIESLDARSYCPRLLTLILKNNIYLKKVSDKIFQSYALRVLDLSNTGIREIPESIGSLVELGYLDLSFTKITSLPKEVRQLVKLKHLGLEGTRFLSTIPENMVLKLSNVMVLNMFDSYGDWEVKICQGEESRASMTELEGLASRKLQDIGITICSTPALSWFLRSHPLTKHTQKLLLKNCQDLSTFRLSSSLKNIRKLNVSNCRILKKFIIGSTGEESLSLEVLQLMGLYRTQILFGVRVVPGDCLSMLREVTVDSCYELRDISWVSPLKNLEHLNLYCCKKIESLIEDDTDEGGQNIKSVIEDDINEAGLERSEAFQKLKTMTLRKLPSLKRICRGTLKFPCLQSLKVLECPQLRTLPLGTGSAEKSMSVICGEKEWWKDLEWEDERAIFEFHKYFQAE